MNQSSQSLIVHHDDHSIRIQENNRNRDFTFDSVSTHDNTSFFHSYIQSNLCDFIDGYNTCILAYGITGTGKTHTIFGNQQQPGVAYQTISYLIKSLQQNQKMILSFYEVYNETIRDLLNESNKPLVIMHESKQGSNINGITQHEVSSVEYAEQLINQGNQKRVLAQTNLNAHSSRSHAIIQVNLKYQQQNKMISPKLFIVDLAGSEKMYFEQKNKNQVEGSNINRSLLALGNCLNILSKKQGNFIPYRNSKLTRILKDCLGGNTRTILISCISQNINQYDEIINTLQYSCRANQIKKKVSKQISIQEVITAITVVNNNKDELEKVYQEIYKNVEEFYEISQSLYDLQNVVQQNHYQIQKIQHRHLYNKWDKLEDDPQYHQLLNYQKENEQIELKLQQGLQQNLETKQQLKQQLFTLYDNNNKQDDQINTLQVDNMHYKQLYQQQQKEIQQKDEQILKLQEQLEKNKITSEPSSFASSKSTSLLKYDNQTIKFPKYPKSPTKKKFPQVAKIELFHSLSPQLKRKFSRPE